MHVYHAGRWINLEMMAGDWAWHYKQYSKDKKLAVSEVITRKAKRGLWADPSPMPPWEFRNGKISPKSETAVIGYWLNESSEVRHNSNCQHYKNTKRGKRCSKTEGQAGRCCGG